MPSDKLPHETGDRVLELLAKSLDPFRSALAATIEEVRGFLAAAGANGEVAENDAVELGRFAAGRIDIERFSALVAHEEPLDANAAAHIERAFATLQSLAERRSELFRVDVPPGGDLRDAVAEGLADVGGAFGAARAVDLTRAGNFHESEHSGLVRRLPFRSWSRAERRLAPPLVVSVDGADLQPAGLAEFLDGRQKLVLVVRGECAPAPLARLVTPATYVVQTNEVDGLAGLASCEGCGVGAVVPESAARFVHDPDGGDVWSARMRVESRPDSAPRKPVGVVSLAQQKEDLAHLEALASAAAGQAEATVSNAAVTAVEEAGAKSAPAGADDPAGKLAAAARAASRDARRSRRDSSRVKRSRPGARR